MAVSRAQLLSTLDTLLKPERFNDYCPNGLQVEGRSEIQRLVTGVTASQALLDAAVASNADAILVHHGYFWRSEPPCITGMKGRRIRTLIRANINLYAYHLPLDCHLELGNNAGLGRVLGVDSYAPVDPANPNLPIFHGRYSRPRKQSEIAAHLSRVLGREVLSETGLGAQAHPQAGPQVDPQVDPQRGLQVGSERLVETVAWCTGGGQGYIDTAANFGADLFVTGEVSEQTIHSAREQGIGFIAAGHHATERFGAKNVGEWLAQELGIWHAFIDIPNPA